MHRTTLIWQEFGEMLVFHVEDDPDISDITKLALETVGGCEVKQFPSGQDALAAACDIRPDVALLDVMMPEMTGPELLNKLRQLDNFARVPVVFMTARVQASEMARFRKLGAIGVIQKPFDPMVLADDLRKLLAAQEPAA